MRLVFRKLSCIIAAALVIGCLSGVSGKAEAGLIPYSVIGVNEFNLPVKYEPFNAFLSYNVYRDEGKSWEGESGARDTFLSVEKYARFFKIDALPSVGFLWEAVVGGIYTSGKDDTSTTGPVHLLAHDVLHLADGAEPQGKVAINAGRQLADHASPQHQLVGYHLRVGRGLFYGGNEIF